MSVLSSKLKENEYITQPVTSSNRIPWVDLARGIAVYMVVLGHLWYSSSTGWFNTILYSAHVPLFLILSGFLFSKKDGQGF